MFRRVVFFIVFATSFAQCGATPAFDARYLVQTSRVIVIGTVRITSSTAAVPGQQGGYSPGRQFLGTVTVDSVLKSFLPVDRVIQIQWTLPVDMTMGYATMTDGSYMVLFLDKAKDNYVFASKYFPGVPATKDASLKNVDEPVMERSEDAVLATVVQQMCEFAKSTSQKVDQRVATLLNLYYSKLSQVRETAMVLVDDPNERIRDQALWVLIRFKEFQYFPRATERILSERYNGSNSQGVGNLILAITQEFPEESVTVILEVLQSNNRDLRRKVAFASRYTRSSRLIQPLLALINDSDTELAWNAMQSLGELTGNLSWRPISRDPEEWERCQGLWRSYSAKQQ